MPTYGRVSRYGLVAFASSLDKIGPFARNIADAAAVLSVIAGHDPNDSTSAAVPVQNYAAEIEKPLQGLANWRPGGLFRRGPRPGSERIKFRRGSRCWSSLGASASRCKCRTRISRPPLTTFSPRRKRARIWPGTMACATGCAFRERHSREMYRKTRSRGFGPEVKRRIMLGTYVLSAGYYDAYYLRAQKVRDR